MCMQQRTLPICGSVQQEDAKERAENVQVILFSKLFNIHQAARQITRQQFADELTQQGVRITIIELLKQYLVHSTLKYFYM